MVGICFSGNRTVHRQIKQIGRQDRLSLTKKLNDPNQCVHVNALKYIAVGAGRHGIAHITVVIMGGQDKDFQFRHGFSQHPNGSDPGKPRHVHIDQCDIRMTA